MSKIEIIKNLTNENLEFQKKLLTFFEMLGITEEDLLKIIEISKNYDALVVKTAELETRLSKVEERLNYAPTSSRDIVQDNGGYF